MYHRHIIRQHLFDMKLSLQNYIVTTNNINIAVIGHLHTVLAGMEVVKVVKVFTML